MYPFQINLRIDRRSRWMQVHNRFAYQE